MPIPLSKLPYLVKQDILREMDLQDIFVLSTLSNRIRHTIKRIMYNQPVYLDAFTNSPILKISKTDDYRSCERNDRMTLDPLNWRRRDLQIQNFISLFGQTVPMEFTEDGIKTFHRNERSYFVPLIGYFAEIFPNIQVHILFGSPNHREFIHTIRLIKQLNIKLESVYITRSRADNRIVTAALEECSEANRLQLHCGTSPSFSYDHQNRAPFEFKSFIISPFKWITTNHFLYLFMNCERVTLVGQLNVSSLPIFATEILRKWTMENSALKNLRIYFDNEHVAVASYIGLIRRLAMNPSIRYVKMPDGRRRLYYNVQEPTRRTGALPYVIVDSQTVRCLELTTD